MNDESTLIGRTLADRYRVESEIARGGMAGVYRARDLRLDRDVAIKVLASPYADDPRFTARFLDEARAAASLSHPSLVHVYDSGSDGRSHYIVMELLDRHRTLRDLLDSEGPRSAEEVLRIGRELLAGLRVVHERGLVHCDVKPANVMLGPGPAKLIDFGIATQPHDGTDGDTSIGSLRFMSPEQLHGQALTPASDLFSLGAVLYESLTGRPPYPGDTPEEVSAAHAAGRVRPPSTVVDGIPGRLDAAILQALRRDPDERFASAEAMAASLDGSADEIAGATRRRYDAGGPRSAAHPGLRPRTGRLRPTRRAAAALADAGRASRPPAPRRGGSAWGLIGTLLVLAAAALGGRARRVPAPRARPRGRGSRGHLQPPSQRPSPIRNTVVVPDLVGMATAEALEAARASGLDWTLYCNEDQSRPEGIIDQEPRAGRQVAPGSTFSLYSARFADCQ